MWRAYGLCLDSFYLFIYFACGYPLVPALFVKKTIFALLYTFCSFFNWSVDCMYVGLFLGSLFYSTDLFDFPFTSTTLYWWLCLYRKSWSGLVSVIQLRFSLSTFCCCSGSSASPRKLQNKCVYSHKITFGDFDWCYIEYIEQAEKNWHLNNILFLSMNIKYLSIYLVLWFCSSKCVVSSYRSCIYFVRFMPKYFIFLDANVNGIVFLILNSTCSFLEYRKVIDFCSLTLYPATLL